MADLQGPQTFLNVLPSMTGYFKKIKAEVQNNKVEQNVDVKVNERRLAKAKSDLESMVKAEEAARKKAADATGAQTVAEAKLQELRNRGITDVGRMAAAEEAVARAKRNSEAAAKALQEAESKRKAGERRVQRVEAQIDTSQAESQFGSFLQRLASRADSDGGGIGSKLISGVGSAMKVGAVAVGGAVAGILGTALTKGFNRLTAIENAQAKLKGLGLAADEIKSVMSDVGASVSGTAFGTNEAADAAAMALSNGIKPGKDLQRTLKLVGDAAAFANKGFGEVAPMFMKVAESGKLGGDVLTQMGENAIPVMAGLQKVTGKTAEEVRKMASDGKIDFETFQKAMEESIGGSALAAGDTFQGSMKNMGAALGRFGETLLSAPFKAAPGVFKGITSGINDINTKTKGVLEVLTTGNFGEAWKQAFPDIEEDSALVDFLFNVRESVLKVKGAIDLLRTGDFTADIGKALGVDEDSALVDKILRVRDGITGLREFIATGNIGEEMARAFDFDMPLLGKFETARETVIDWGAQIGRILGTVKDIFVELGPPVGDIIASLGQASVAIGISTWQIFLDLLEALLPVIKDILVPAVETLAQLMSEHPGLVTAVVGAYTAYRLAVLGAAGAMKAKAAADKVSEIAVKASIAAEKTRELLMKSNVINSFVTMLRWKAQAENISTGAALRAITVEKLRAGALKVSTVAQKLFNAAMKANPIMKIITVISLLVGALVWFFTKTELGKKIWDKIWTGIQTALSAAWDFIKPIFDKLGEIFTWLYENIIQPIFTALKIALAIVMTAFLLWWQLISFVIGKVGEVLSWLWENVAQPVWEKMKEALAKVGDFFKWVWESLIKPAWDGLGAGISWVWENIIRPAWDGLKAALQAVGDFFGWVWNTLIKPAWDGLGAGISWVWENIIRPAWDALKGALQAVGDFFVMIWERFIKPTWDKLGEGINWVWENVIKKAWDKMQEGLGKLRDFFDTIVEGIRGIWDKLKGYLAKPVNFLINTVWNKGIREAWNTVRKFIPGLPEAQEMGGIPEYATGGRVDGPGTTTSDSILARLSRDEHVWDALDVSRAGGHGVMYAMRAMIERGIPFTWDAAKGLVNTVSDRALAAYGQASDKLGRPAPSEGMFHGVLPGFAEGGAVREGAPWEQVLVAAHEWAKARHGRPYVLGGSAEGSGGTDCSGFMSGIANFILGGNGARQWATMAFNGGGNEQYPSGPQGFVAGLAKGFSIGVTNGGEAGGHTAGTLSAAGPYPATNVESGGSPSMVKYGTGAAGADDPYFRTHYHLPIGADGAFETAGGPTPAQKQDFLTKKISEILDKVLNPIKDGIGAIIGTAPPEWHDIPPKYLDTGRDKVSGFLAEKVLGLGEFLSDAWNKAKDIGHVMTFGLFRDQGGWIPNGLSIVRNETGKPEAVLNWEQVMALKTLFETGEYTDSLAAMGLSKDSPYVEAVLTARANIDAAGQYASEIDWGGVGSQIGTSLLAEWGNDLLGIAGLSSQFEGLKLVDETGRRSDEAGTRNEASFHDAAPAEPSTGEAPQYGDPNTQLVEQRVELTPMPGLSGNETGETSVVEAVKRAFSPFGWDSGEQWAAVDFIVGKESGWNPLARNPQSGAFSLFQFLGTTKDQYLPDESPDPYVQGLAGRDYIRDRYGDPIRARSFWEKNGYYDQGGIARGKGYLLKDVIHPERVLSPRQTETFEQLIPMLDRMQQQVTAPADVMPASALSSLEYAPVGVGGDTFNVYGEPTRRTMNEVGIWSNQRARTKRYDRGQR